MAEREPAVVHPRAPFHSPGLNAIDSTHWAGDHLGGQET